MRAISLWLAVILALWAGPGSALANDQDVLERALGDALVQFERALPQLGASVDGVDVAAYRDALSRQRFDGGAWGGPVRLELRMGMEDGGGCGRFAAYVRLPPEAGTVRMVLCRQFFEEGHDALRRLTVLHEMVHVVAGPDECRAMAFAARIEQLATGSFTPVDAYWRAQGCETSAFGLP